MFKLPYKPCIVDTQLLLGKHPDYAAERSILLSLSAARVEIVTFAASRPLGCFSFPRAKTHAGVTTEGVAIAIAIAIRLLLHFGYCTNWIELQFSFVRHLVQI